MLYYYQFINIFMNIIKFLTNILIDIKVYNR